MPIIGLGRKRSFFFLSTPTWGSFASIQVNLTECLLSDLAESAASFSYRLATSYRVPLAEQMPWPDPSPEPGGAGAEKVGDGMGTGSPEAGKPELHSLATDLRVAVIRAAPRPPPVIRVPQ
jgi:hypothetical protein